MTAAAWKIDENERLLQLVAMDKSALPADGGPRFNRLIFATSPYHIWVPLVLHIMLWTAVMILPLYSLGCPWTTRCGESRLFSRMIRNTRLRPTLSPLTNFSRAQTLRCPSPMKADASKSVRMRASTSSSVSGVFGPRLSWMEGTAFLVTRP